MNMNLQASISSGFDMTGLEETSMHSTLDFRIHIMNLGIPRVSVSVLWGQEVNYSKMLTCTSICYAILRLKPTVFFGCNTGSDNTPKWLRCSNSLILKEPAFPHLLPNRLAARPCCHIPTQAHNLDMALIANCRPGARNRDCNCAIWEHSSMTGNPCHATCQPFVILCHRNCQACLSIKVN